MKPAPTLAVTLQQLQQHEHDPQAALTALVHLHELVSSSTPSLSLPSGSPSLSHAVALLQRLLHANMIQHQEEIVWFIARVTSAWARRCARFQLEAGRVRLWNQLQLARVAFPQSLRVLEMTLDATTALLQCLEYHQQLITASDSQLVQELLDLLERSTSDSTIVVVCTKTLASLYASPRVVETFGDQYTRRLARLLPTILPHFFTTADATCAWLALSRQLVKLKTSLTLPLLFQATEAASSWCRQLLSYWQHEPAVVYALCALLSQLFLPVPHVLSSPVDPPLANSLLHDHALLELLTDRLRDYFFQLHSPATLCDRARRQLQATAMEIVRVIRQWSFVPEVLVLFPSVAATRKTLVPLLITRIERCQIELDQLSEVDVVQWRCRLLLELLLTLQQLHRSAGLARIINSSVGLRPCVLLMLKQRGYVALFSERLDPNDAGDSDLAAVLERELKKTLAMLSTAVSIKSSAAASSSSTSQRVLHRVPSSSPKELPLSSSSSASASTTLTVRRTPPSSSHIRIS